MAKTCAGRTPWTVARDLNYPDITRALSQTSSNTTHEQEEEMAETKAELGEEKLCDTCEHPIPIADSFYTCPICRGDDWEDLIVCQECLTGGLGCFDKLHTLQRKAFIDGLLTTVDKISGWD
jgi:hypothetical protein